MISDIIQYDIKVVGAFKSYGETNVLNGLTLKIPSGSIYGLLGPSGCGKSTLIKCILGSIPLDFGSIDLNVNSIKNVGYMPQDICLDCTLTIRETFKYYGTLYGMSKKDIENRIDELNKFLILPNLNSYMNKISGGQCRRVSLAISLLHNPKVIILDEPTIGIDPLLRQTIWAEFSKMVKDHGKTIIITTHYIEEANQANHIGLMKDGILIDGGSPRDILTRHSTDTLEAAFLKLCCEQLQNTIVPNEVHVNDKIKSNILTQFENKINLHRIKALIEKDYRVCSRDNLLLITMILLPILQCFIFCSSVGVNFKGMNIAIKNDEVNILNCQHFDIDGCIFDENNNTTMSCVVMNYFMSHNYKLVEVKDRQVGEESMNNPNYMAFLYFPKNYTKDLMEYINDRTNYNTASGSFALLTTENVLFVNQIETDVLDSLKNVLDTISNSCSYNAKQTSMAALDFNIITGQEVKSHANSTITTYIALLVYYCPSLFGVSIMLSAKLDGILCRSMSAGVKISEVMISLFCIITALILVQIFTTCFISYVVLNNPIQITTNGLFVYTILILILGWLGFFFGVISAVFSTSFVGGCNIITGSYFTQILLSGTFWPIEGQPKLLRMVSELLPVRLISKSLNDIILRGFVWNHPSIITGISSAVVYFMVFLFALIVLGKFKIHWWIGHK